MREAARIAAIRDELAASSRAIYIEQAARSAEAERLNAAKAKYKQLAEGAKAETERNIAAGNLSPAAVAVHQRLKAVSETVDKMKTAPWLKGAASLLQGSDRRASSFRQLKASDEALEKSNSALRRQIEGLEQELDDPAPSPSPGPKRVTAAVRGARP